VSPPVRLPVFDVQRFCVHDGPGIRTMVFFEGCPLRCAWCQNPEAFREGRAAPRTVDEVVAEVLEDRDYYAVSGGGLTLSGGEPLLHAEAAVALLRAARSRGLHTVVQTSGVVPEASLEAVLGLVDLFQVDLKHMRSPRHRELTGAGNERVHASVALLLARGAAVDVRMPLVPGVNDDDENVDAVAAWLGERAVRTLGLVPYQRMYLAKYAALGLAPRLRDVAPPSAAALARVAERLARRGVTARVDG
jgi:pyruvate formate lyase activating enzyme